MWHILVILIFLLYYQIICVFVHLFVERILILVIESIHDKVNSTRSRWGVGQCSLPYSDYWEHFFLGGGGGKQGGAQKRGWGGGEEGGE